ncbi:MAG TPA: hypothetical protein VIK06_08110 [Candidatus Limnocylindrales bacterium]|jgi:hypothetical protein
MKVVVVYESPWGNTAAIARAVAEGVGPEACALSTAEASRHAMSNVDLIVASAPVLGFQFPCATMRETVLSTPADAPTPADLSSPSMRAWLAGLTPGCARFATFETVLRWSPGATTLAIGRGLQRVGYRPVMEGRRFVVCGKWGPLREGELDRARRWGAELARTAASLPG